MPGRCCFHAQLQGNRCQIRFWFGQLHLPALLCPVSSVSKLMGFVGSGLQRRPMPNVGSSQETYSKSRKLHVPFFVSDTPAPALAPGAGIDHLFEGTTTSFRQRHHRHCLTRRRSSRTRCHCCPPAAPSPSAPPPALPARRGSSAVPPAAESGICAMACHARAIVHSALYTHTHARADQRARAPTHLCNL